MLISLCIFLLRIYVSNILSIYFRNDDQWPGDSKNGPSESEQPTYDGPPGMDPDGIIESNWDVVSNLILAF